MPTATWSRERRIALPSDMVGGQSIETIVTGMGYAYATTSYRHNGLVAAEAAQDVSDLQIQVRTLFRPDPVKSVIVGSVRGRAGRGPGGRAGAPRLRWRAGTVRAGGQPRARELDYLDDFRVVFDYLFPGVIPGSPIEVPGGGHRSLERPVSRRRWRRRFCCGPAAARELIAITGAPVASQSPIDIATTAVAHPLVQRHRVGRRAGPAGRQPLRQHAPGSIPAPPTMSR